MTPTFSNDVPVPAPEKSSESRPRWVGLVATVVLAAGMAFGAVIVPAAARQAAPSLEDELAAKYVPVAYLRQQEAACAKPPDGGEPYVPAPVEIILDNSDVTLQQTGTGDETDDPVLLTAPRATDLVGQSADTYLNFPGNARDAGCDYEQHARQRMTELGLEPTTYAHLVVDTPNRRLALQYWFFYYFNDWNNTHETDWEMIQVMWEDVGGVEDALRKDPRTVGYAQHGGGELAEWGDDKLTIEDGTHPAVYPGAGSHATFFGSETYIAWGENGTGFGCDLTTAPLVRTTLTPVVVPNTPDPDGPFAWLLYQGRWGERQPAVYNGPTGPNLGTKWSDPWEAVANWRTASLKVPASKTLGPTATDLFCSVSASVSQVAIAAGVYPWLAVGLLGAVLTVLVVLVYRAWAYFALAIAVYARYWKAFLGIGLLAIPIGWAFNGIEVLLVEIPPMEWVVKWFNDTAGARLTAALIVGIAQQIVMLLVIGPAVIEAVFEIKQGRVPTVVESYRRAFRRLGALVRALSILVVTVGALVFVIVGFPVALWLLIRWQFFGQAVIFGHADGGRSALAASARAVKGKWWRTLEASFVFQLMATLPGPLIGIILLVFLESTVELANGISSFIYALTIPLAVIALTMVYLHHRGEPLAIEGKRTVPEPEAAAGTVPA